MPRAAAYLSALLFVVQGRFEGRKDRGATAVEYGLMVGLIAVAIIALVATLGESLAGFFTTVNTELGGS